MRNTIAQESAAQKILHVGVVQQSCTDDVVANFAKSVAQIRIAAQKGAQLVVLQELHRGLYFCQQEMAVQFDLAETIPGPTTQSLGALAQELNIVIVASLFEKRAVGVYHNTAVVIERDGSIAGKYRKMHIPDDPGYYEKFYFTPGDLGFHPIQTSVGSLGILVCWDQWFPEAARLMAMAGAELLIYPTAIGWDTNEPDPNMNTEQYNAWQTIQRSHAVANGLHVVSVNRVGREADQQFWGGSFVANPFGSLLYLASHDKEEVHVQEIDLDLTEKYRTTWPYLRDRRVDSYGPILKRFID